MASVSTIGTTYLGKPMKIITMSTKPGSKRPTLFYDGGLHARYAQSRVFAYVTIISTHPLMSSLSSNIESGLPSAL
jgi:hypothetical protein